jgi:hypothetical protein
VLSFDFIRGVITLVLLAALFLLNIRLFLDETSSRSSEPWAANRDSRVSEMVPILDRGAFES